MLKNECNALQNFKHKYIIELYEIYQEENELILITEYLPGGEIYKRLRKMKKFSEQMASEIIFYIAKALRFLHKYFYSQYFFA